MLFCVECWCVSQTGHGWFAYLAEDPDDDEGPIVGTYCRLAPPATSMPSPAYTSTSDSSSSRMKRERYEQREQYCRRADEYPFPRERVISDADALVSATGCRR